MKFPFVVHIDKTTDNFTPSSIKREAKLDLVYFPTEKNITEHICVNYITETYFN